MSQDTQNTPKPSFFGRIYNRLPSSETVFGFAGQCASETIRQLSSVNPLVEFLALVPAAAAAALTGINCFSPTNGTDAEFAAVSKIPKAVDFAWEVLKERGWGCHYLPSNTTFSDIKEIVTKNFPGFVLCLDGNAAWAVDGLTNAAKCSTNKLGAVAELGANAVTGQEFRIVATYVVVGVGAAAILGLLGFSGARKLYRNCQARRNDPERQPIVQVDDAEKKVDLGAPHYGM